MHRPHPQQPSRNQKLARKTFYIIAISPMRQFTMHRVPSTPVVLINTDGGNVSVPKNFMVVLSPWLIN